MLGLLPEVAWAVTGLNLCYFLSISDLPNTSAREASNLAAAEKILGRSLSQAQLQAVRKYTPYDADTPISESVAREQIQGLKGTGFTADEIGLMRRDGILSRYQFQYAASAPRELRVAEGLRLTDISGRHYREAETGQFPQYVVSEVGHVYVVDGRFDFGDPSVLWVAAHTDRHEVTESFLIKDHGILHYDPAIRKFSLRTEGGLALSPEEIVEISNSVREQFHGGEKRVVRVDDRKREKSEVLTCTQIESSRRQGKNFLLDAIVGENIVNSAAILSGDYFFNAHRLDNKEGLQVVFADFVGGNINSAISAQVNRKLVLRGANEKIKAGVNSGLGFGAAPLIQQQVHQMVFAMGGNDDQKAKERSKKLYWFNIGHSLFKLYPNSLINRKLIEAELVDACLKGKVTRVLVSSSALRIYERTLSAIFYYGSRKLIVDE